MLRRATTYHPPPTTNHQPLAAPTTTALPPTTSSTPTLNNPPNPSSFPAGYEALARIPWRGPGCTGIIAIDSTDGSVNHARNLDFAPVDIMQVGAWVLDGWVRGW